TKEAWMKLFPTPVLVLYLLSCLAFSSLARAQEAPLPQAPAAEDLQALLGTLEDPLAREAFLERLRTLTELQTAAAQEEPEETLATGLLEAASRMAAELSEEVAVLGERLREAPAMGQRLWESLQQPATQRLLLEVGVKVSGVFL